MAAFPSTLPSPAKSGFTVEPFEQTIRTEMEVGTPRVRRRSAVRNDTLSVEWRLTDDEMLLFRAWFDSPDYAAGGAAWFTIDLPTGDGGLRNIEARFVGRPRFGVLPGLNWQVTATLETRGGTLTADQLRGAIEGLVLDNVYPTLILDFVNDAAIDSRITYTGGLGSYRDSTGAIVAATTNVARLDHDAAGVRLGLLSEESRTNLLLNSATLSTQSVTVTAVAHTISFIGTGSITLSGAATGTLNGTGGSDKVSLSFTPSAGSLTVTVSGSVKNANLEIGAFATTWIPTTAAAATRTADNARLLSAAFSSWYAQAGGTFVVEATATADGIAKTLTYVYGGNAAERANLIISVTSNATNVQIVSAATDTLGSYSPTWTTGTHGVAFTYKENDGEVYVDGTGSAPDTSVTMPTGTMTSLSLGRNAGASQFVNGHIRRVMFYPARLTAASLAVASAWRA